MLHFPTCSSPDAGLCCSALSCEWICWLYFILCLNAFRKLTITWKSWNKNHPQIWPHLLIMRDSHEIYLVENTNGRKRSNSTWIWNVHLTYFSHDVHGLRDFFPRLFEGTSHYRNIVTSLNPECANKYNLSYFICSI